MESNNEFVGFYVEKLNIKLAELVKSETILATQVFYYENIIKALQARIAELEGQLTEATATETSSETSEEVVIPVKRRKASDNTF